MGEHTLSRRGSISSSRRSLGTQELACFQSRGSSAIAGPRWPQDKQLQNVTVITTMFLGRLGLVDSFAAWPCSMSRHSYTPHIAAHVYTHVCTHVDAVDAHVYAHVHTHVHTDFVCIIAPIRADAHTCAYARWHVYWCLSSHRDIQPPLRLALASR